MACEQLPNATFVVQRSELAAAATPIGPKTLEIGSGELFYDRLDVAALTEIDRPTAADFGGANAMGLLVSRCEAATFHRAAGLDRSLYWAETRDQLNAADTVPATDYIDADVRERLRSIAPAGTGFGIR